MQQSGQEICLLLEEPEGLEQKYQQRLQTRQQSKMHEGLGAPMGSSSNRHNHRDGLPYNIINALEVLQFTIRGVTAKRTIMRVRMFNA